MDNSSADFRPAVPLNVRKKFAPATVLGAWTDDPFTGYPPSIFPINFQVLLQLEEPGGEEKWILADYLFGQQRVDRKTNARTYVGEVFSRATEVDVFDAASWFRTHGWTRAEAPASVQSYRVVGREMPLPETPAIERLIPILRDWCTNADLFLKAGELGRGPKELFGGAEDSYKDLREQACSVIDHVMRHYNALAFENLTDHWGERPVPKRRAGSKEELRREGALKAIQEALLPVVVQQKEITGGTVAAIRGGVDSLSPQRIPKSEVGGDFQGDNSSGPIPKVARRRTLAKNKGMASVAAEDGGPSVDLLIVAALNDELEPVKQELDLKLIPGKRGETNQYFGGKSQGVARAVLEVRAFAVGDKGGTPCGVALSQALSRWKPHFLVMVGIAASLPGGSRKAGDLIIASWIVDLTESKVKSRKRTRQPRPAECSVALRTRIEALLLSSTRKDIHLGAVVAQADVVKQASLRDELVAAARKAVPCEVVGIEMEGGGLACAIARQASAERAEFILVKGIVDFANYSKNDRARKRAKKKVASFLKDLLLSGLFMSDGRPTTFASRRGK